MKRSALVLTLLLLTLFTVRFSNSHAGAAAVKEARTSVKSKNFTLVGNAGEKDIRKVAAKLEQFRDVFGQLFSKANLNSPIPIKVVVFKNRDAYRPFMPVYQGKVNEVAGYFMPGEDVNDYIRGSSYPVQTFSFDQKIQFDASMEATQMSEAEWNYHLGDLVLHLNRTDSESYLKKAMAINFAGCWSRSVALTKA